MTSSSKADLLAICSVVAESTASLDDGKGASIFSPFRFGSPLLVSFCQPAGTHIVRNSHGEKSNHHAWNGRHSTSTQEQPGSMQRLECKTHNADYCMNYCHDTLMQSQIRALISEFLKTSLLYCNVLTDEPKRSLWPRCGAAFAL